MPYSDMWVPPELALLYRGVAVWHVYKDDRLEDPLMYYYTLDPKSGDDAEDQFDVREFPSYKKELSTEDNLRAAIDQGYLQSPDQVIAIPTSFGPIVAFKNYDPNYPGLWVRIGKDDLVLVEECDGVIKLRVWDPSDPENDPMAMFDMTPQEDKGEEDDSNSNADRP